MRRATDRYDGPAYAALRDALADREGVPTDHPYWAEEAACSMHIEEVEAIWAAIAERDDWAPLHAKVAAIRRMAEAHHRSPAEAGAEP